MPDASTHPTNSGCWSILLSSPSGKPVDAATCVTPVQFPWCALIEEGR